MPILDVDEFKVHYLSVEGISESVSSSTNLSLEPAVDDRPRTFIFCLNECDALLALHVLQVHKIYHISNGVEQDVMYITCIEDVYNFIDEQVKAKLEFPQLQLLRYQYVMLIGFGGHAFTDPHLYSELHKHFSGLLPTEKEKEQLQFWVFDFRRPVFALFEEEAEPWFLILTKQEFLEWKQEKDKPEQKKKTAFSTTNPVKGLYFSSPICFLMNQIVWEVGVNQAIYAKNNFLASMSLFWHHLQQYIDTESYEDMLRKLKEDIAMHQYNRYPGDEYSLNTQYGMLPFLQYSCLYDALNASEHLFVRIHDLSENERDNEIRINCGVTKKELKSHQAEFRITNKEVEVRSYLHETYGLSANTLDWARPEYPDLNNAALAYMANFMLSFCKDNDSPKDSYVGNCRDFHEVIETLVNVNHSYDLNTETYLLQSIMPASRSHLQELFEKIRSSRIEGRKCGGETVWLINFRSLKSIYLHSMQLRNVALLASAYKAKGDYSRRSSVILSFSRINNADEIIIYAANPSADRKHPDFWPAILRWLSKKNIVKLNVMHPNMAIVRPERLHDVRQQMLDLYRQRHDPFILSIDEMASGKRKSLYSQDSLPWDSDVDPRPRRIKRRHVGHSYDEPLLSDVTSEYVSEVASNAGTEKHSYAVMDARNMQSSEYNSEEESILDLE